MSATTKQPRPIASADDSTSVPPGYKRSEVGMIPEDWEVLRFCEHFNIYAGGDVPKDSFSQIRSEECAYPIYANAIQNQGLYGFTRYKRGKSGSVTITARGYLGHAEYRAEPFFPIVRLLVLEPTGSLDAKYTTYSINDRVTFSIESTGVPQLTAPQVGKYSVAAPKSLPEQRAIAEALSDVDGLLGALEALIAKKRAIKQGAMQQLLTGKTRLPGFSGEWKTISIDQIATRITGFWGAGHISELATNQIGVIRAGDISPLGELTSFAQRYFSDSELAKAACHVGDVVMTVSGNGLGKVWLVDGQSPLAASNFVRLLRSKSTHTSSQFLFYALKSDTAIRLLAEHTATSAYPNLRPSFFSTVWLALPQIAEQSAIATVLSDMDAEIAALEARRDKTSAIKQGMMQQLLTGRVRLVKPQGEANA